MFRFRILFVCITLISLSFYSDSFIIQAKGDSKKAKRSLHQIKKAIKTTKNELARLKKNEQVRKNRLKNLQSESKNLQHKAGQLASRLSLLHDSTTQLSNAAQQLFVKDSIMRTNLMSLAKYYARHNNTVSPDRYEARTIARSIAMKSTFQTIVEQRKVVQSDYQNIVAEALKLDSLTGNNEIELFLTTEQKSRLDKEISANSGQLAEIRKNKVLMEKELREKERSAGKIADLLKQLAREQKKKSKKINLQPKHEKNQNSVVNKGNFRYPLESTRILRNYGIYKNDKSGVILQNPGVDFSAKTGTRALCSSDGVVSLVYTLSGYNTIVIVEHTNGIRTVYGNLFKTYVRKGDNIQKGQPVGITGETIDGEYLHFEVWRGTKNVNPMGVLR